jgi:hypothetical protein
VRWSAVPQTTTLRIKSGDPMIHPIQQAVGKTKQVIDGMHAEQRVGLQDRPHTSPLMNQNFQKVYSRYVLRVFMGRVVHLYKHN